MATTADRLKSLLHESIENIDDEDLLRTVKDILDRKYQPAENIQLSSVQEQRIEQAQESIKRGDYLTNEQADQLVAQWLNK
ncbi:MAG: hypothetical protein ACQETE_09760 [Bacteroidota bacterium]|jgi:hypothetical protein